MSAPPAAPRAVVWTLAAVATVGYGALYYAQPLLALAAEEERGWTRAQTGLAFTLALLVTALLAPAVGRALDARGGRFLLGGGALLGALALALMALSPSFPAFVLAWLLAGAAMALTFYEAVFTVLGQNVGGPGRPRATLTVTLVAGLASTVFVPLTAVLLTGGLRGALLGLAALLAAAGGLALWQVPRRAASAATTPPPPFAPDATFARLTRAFTLARLVTVGVGLQLAPLLIAAGHPPERAAALTGLAGLAALPGRVLFTALLERLGAAALTRLLMGGLGLGAIALLSPASVLVAGAGVGVFGLCSGALTLARAELLSRLVPPGTFGAANGRMARPVNLAQALTPLGVGALYTLSGGYAASLLLLAVAAGTAAWALRGLPPSPPR